LVGIFYYKYRYKFDKRVSQFLILSIIATVLSELSFTFYIRNYDILNQIGHILKIISFYFIYTSIVTTGINKPENIIYRELNLTNKKLKETLSKLELSNKELEQFSYVVAHDLKNPLAVIISGMRILKNYYSKHNDDHSIEIINSVDKTANRMSQMINHLLDYSKIHKNQANYSIIEVKDILHMAMDNLKVLIDDTQAIITYDKLPKIKCDKILMISLFQNLISNALKYRRKDIIPKIHIGVLEQEHHYLFSVSDNGIGINSKFLEKIFMIFTRINDDKDTNEGHGIGLAYCKKIVEKHNGKIWVESKINEGSTFYFTILK
jgi:light-regulated signal transduction histidine kinase (bacteriophytochrome)